MKEDKKSLEVEGGSRMTLADQIRQFAFLNYIMPARSIGENEVSIRVGDIHGQMALSNRLPAVCAALGSKKFERLCNIKRLSVEGPLNGSSPVFNFSLQ